MTSYRLPALVLPLALAALCAGPASAQETDLAARALALVNEARAAEGLDALAPSGVLDEAARAHAEDMLARDFYDHVTPEGTTARDRFLAAGGDVGAVSGENIARCTGCPTPPGAERVEAFHGGWMQSPGHRANVLSLGFARFGYAITGRGGETYAVQTFAGPGASEGTDVAPEALAEALRDELNARRAEAGLAALDADPALDAAAQAALDAFAVEGALPSDLFALLPEGAEGWATLGMRASSRGGAGATLTTGDEPAFADALAENGPPGGADATHAGIAVQSDGQGGKTVVAVFGGRG
jgi:uncharacterized protein YkwD